MFNIKQFVNRITDNKNERDGSGGESSAAFVDNEEQHSAEGFLCPPCMKAFPSPEALEEHYKKTHENDASSPDSNSNSNGDTQLLRQEIQLLQDSLAEEKANCEGLKKEMLKMQADINAKEFDATSHRSQEKELEDSKTFLTSEVTLLRQQLADSLEQISMLRKEKESGTSKAELSSTENEKLKKEIHSLETQLSHRNSVDDAEVLRQELVSVQKLMDQLALEKEKEIETLNNKLNEMQPSIPTDKLEEQLNQTLRELQVLKQKNEEVEQKHIETIKKYTDEMSQKNAKISELDNLSEMGVKKVEMLSQECHQLKGECSRLREQHSELCSKIETGEGAKAALEGLQQENTIMKKNLDGVHVQNRELSKQNHDLSLQLEKSSAENKAAQAELVNKEREYNVLRSQMEATLVARENEIEGLNAANLKYSTQVQQYESDLKILKNEKIRLGEQISKLEAVAKEFKEKEEEQQKTISGQAAQIDKLQEALKTTEASLSEVRKELETSRNEMQSAQDTINDLQTALSAKTTELSQTEENYNGQISSLTIQLSEKEEALEEKSKELLGLEKTMSEQMATLRNKLDSVESELRMKKSDLQEKSNAMKEVIEKMKENEQKLQLFETKVNEMIEHKLQLERTCESNEEEKSQLLEKLISYESETKSLNTTIEELTRKRDDAMAALQELGRENQSLQIEIAKIQGRKWADDSNVSNCSSCTKEFTLTFRKHHCRHCGQIFCSDCSSKSASVPSSKKPVRVCDGCYVKLTTQ